MAGKEEKGILYPSRLVPKTNSFIASYTEPRIGTAAKSASKGSTVERLVGDAPFPDGRKSVNAVFLAVAAADKVSGNLP